MLGLEVTPERYHRIRQSQNNGENRKMEQHGANSLRWGPWAMRDCLTFKTSASETTSNAQNKPGSNYTGLFMAALFSFVKHSAFQAPSRGGTYE